MSENTQVAETAKKRKIATPSADHPVTVSRNEIKEWLNAGFTRQEIMGKLGVNLTVLNAIMSHPELKGLKTKKDPSRAFVFVEDLQAQGTANAANTEASEANSAEATTTQVIEPTPAQEGSGW